jgi:hypothetical protein
MPQALLSAPLPVNPEQATRIVLRSSLLEHGANAMLVTFDLVNASGAVVESRALTLSGAAITTWFATNEPILVQRLLTRLGLSGTIS